MRTMIRLAPLAAILVLAGSPLGCVKKPPPEEQPAVPSPSAPVNSAPLAAGPNSASPPFDPAAVGGLKLTLDRESASRPTGTPKAEQVFAALEKAGVKVDGIRQQLGATHGANYCSGGATAAGLGVNVCEYADAEAATAGRERSLKLLAGIKNREIFVNKKTTLTMMRGDGATGAAQERDKAVEAFKKL